MKPFLLYVFYACCAAALQTTWFGAFPSRFVRFDLLFMAVMAISLGAGEKKSSVATLLTLGAIADLASGAPFGLSLFSYLVVFSCMRGLFSQITLQTPFAQFVWSAMMSMIDKLTCAALLASWARSPSPFSLWLPRAIPQALSDALLGLAMIPFLRWYIGITKETFVPAKGLQSMDS